MLKKIVSVDLVEITENGFVQVRTATKILEDDKELSRTYHRHVILPGQDYSAEDAKVKAICAAMHTAETINAYQAALEAEKPLAKE
jgi:hypothetical protein